MYDLYVDENFEVVENEQGDLVPVDTIDPDYEAEMANNNYEGDVFGDCGEF